MATLTINIQVVNLEQVLQNFDVIKVYRTETVDVNGDPIGFAEITTPSTRIAMTSTSAFYTYIDTTGTTSSYYTTSYFNSSTSAESSQSPPSKGKPNPALSILSVDELKDRYLFGVDLTDDNGTPMSDSALAFYIESALDQATQLLDLPIAPETIVEERHDFFKQEYYKYIHLQADKYPIIEIDRLRLVLPTDNEVIEFPREWIFVQKFSGQIDLVPGNGQISVVTLGQTGAWLPLIYGWTDFIPEVFRLDYRAGFENDYVPHNIIDMMGMLASFGPLNVAGDLILGAGIASQQISLDQIQTSIASTQSATNAGYGARLVTYGRKLKEMTPEIRRYWKGIRFKAG